MRAAPPVTVDIGISAAWRAVQAVLFACAGGALTAWALAWAGFLPAWGVPVALAVGAAAWYLLPQAAVSLAWDGQSWQLADSPVQVTVALDLDRWVLLRLWASVGVARSRWLPATASQSATRWHALRAALYSRAPESPPAAPSPDGPVAPD